MTESHHYLSPTGRRAVAAAALSAADPTVPPAVATATVDILDRVAAAVLDAVAVLSPAAQRGVLAVMWTEQ